MLLKHRRASRVGLLAGALPAFFTLACSAGESFGRHLAIRSQADAEAAAGTTALDFLLVTGDVTDLSPLLSLTSVHNEVSVSGTTALRSLHGLENVRAEIFEAEPFLSVRIEDNAALEDVSALKMPRALELNLLGGNSALASVEFAIIELYDLWIDREPSVMALRSSTLETVSDVLEVSLSPQLCTVELPALHTLGTIVTSAEPCWSEEDRATLLEQAGAEE